MPFIYYDVLLALPWTFDISPWTHNLGDICGSQFTYRVLNSINLASFPWITSDGSTISIQLYSNSLTG